MKKIGWLLIVCGIVWLLKLSYDFYHLSNNYANTAQQLQQIEKYNKQLNDQIMALNRQVEQPKKATGTVTAPMLAVPSINVMALIEQKLQLIEFALQQQQHMLALQQLQDLNQQIDTYELAPALRDSLHQVMNKDIALIQQYALQITVQQQKVDEILQKVDQQLAQALLSPDLTVANQTEDYFWQRWFKLERADTVATALSQRSLILKEVQLRLLLLRQLTAENQYLLLQDELEQINALLKSLPDQQSRQLLQQLAKLQSLAKLSVPQLNTRTLVN